MHTFIDDFFDKNQINKVEKLPQAGSNRIYHRIHLIHGESYIACRNANVQENETYFYFTDCFKKYGIAVPTIFFISKNRENYIVEDLGNESLLDRVTQINNETELEILYKHSLDGLLAMQIKAGSDIDFNKCFYNSKFDSDAVLADLNYCKYYFLDLIGISYDQPKFQKEIKQFAEDISLETYNHFMFRDFQGRNILLKNNKPYFIDFQGGMKGPLQYDVASLLWQAKAQLSSSFKEKLYQYYKEKLSQEIEFNELDFDNQYKKIVFVRLLQVLGAYGLRGIIEQKTHFLNSIPFALKNLNEWNSRNKTCLEKYPILQSIVEQLTNDSVIEKFLEKKYTSNSPLKIIVQSFSYKKGIPEDVSGNGGGFMFDCRGILNPGRFEEYKKLTGRDKEVIDFLETKTKISDFLFYAKKVVDISVQDYLERNFENLQISFGCTGGQHRSVYCADNMAIYLKEKYAIEVEVRHLIQDEKNWNNDTVSM